MIPTWGGKGVGGSHLGGVREKGRGQLGTVRMDSCLLGEVKDGR